MRAAIKREPRQTHYQKLELEALDLLKTIPANLIGPLYNTGVFNLMTEVYAAEALERLNHSAGKDLVNVNDFRRELAAVHNETLLSLVGELPEPKLN